VTAETRIAEPQESPAVSVKGALWLAAGFGLLNYVLSTLGQITIQHAGLNTATRYLFTRVLLRGINSSAEFAAIGMPSSD